MKFSQSSSEGRLKELKFFRWVLLGAAIAAVGVHLSSAPLLLRFVNNVFGGLELDVVEEPIEVILVEEEVPEPEAPVTPPPPSEAAIENEPAASAPADSAPPLRTSDSVVPTPPTAESIETVPTESAIATEDGVEGGEGAAGNAGSIGLLRGDGSTEGDPSDPVGPPNVQPAPVERQPVQEVARARPPAARQVACNPCSTPDYPLSEQRERIQGQPVINVIFDGNGNVVRAVIERSSGSNALDQAALEEAQANWRFDDPYRLGGQVSVEVPFVIEGTDQFAAAQAAGQREVIALPVQQSIVPVSPATAGTTPTTAAPAADDAESVEPPAADVDPAPAAPAGEEPVDAEPDDGAEPVSSPSETNTPPAAGDRVPESTPPAAGDRPSTVAPESPAPAAPASIPQANPAPQPAPAPPTPVPERRTEPANAEAAGE
ncbi:MAG: energy transducer TonB [Cyanobacteria bacterium P01_C01_bin.120]